MKKLIEIPTGELAELLKVTPPYISHIKHGRRKLSARQALKISREYEIPLWDLRPDVYPKELFEVEQNG